jgi:hypothetical protein
MKYCFLVLIGFFLFFDISFAQPKYDYNWLFGYQGGLGNPNFGQSKISFDNGQIETTTTISDLYIGESNTTMSDTDGNLAFYTNGCAIFNSEHQMMENGDEINPGEVHDDYCDVIGYPNGKQACLALPLPGSSGHYILFHQPSEIISIPPFDFDIIRPLLYYSIIDMDQADGLGEVVDKNHIIVEDSLHTGHITAVKHTNGRDWWVLVPERQSARHHTLIVTPTGVVDTFSQEVGIPFLYEGEGSGQACFSPDGLKYLRYT